jgi:glycosyltransferase involved in cell wall biosynthesis
MAESQRDTAGDKHLEGRLNAVFTTFRYFDHLVSVSAELAQVNTAKLAEYAPPEKFTYASNTIDQERVLSMAGLDENGERVHGEQETFDTANLAATLASLLEHFDARSIAREARARARMSYVPKRGNGNVTFVAVGRISPEKNHGRLIRAFARVHERHPHTRLVVLGDGRLMPQVAELVESLGLAEYVSLAGQVDNPYAIMAECDCFVISSNYEGQPMVVLEARTLDLPVISTRFPSVAGSVPDGAGVVVEQTDDALVEGMEKFLANQVPSKRLDWEAYNADAMQQFYRAIGADRAS